VFFFNTKLNATPQEKWPHCEIIIIIHWEKKEKSFLSMFCVCYHTKTSSIMSANLRVGISILPLALYTKLFCQVWPNKRYNVAERKKIYKGSVQWGFSLFGVVLELYFSPIWGSCELDLILKKIKC